MGVEQQQQNQQLSSTTTTTTSNNETVKPFYMPEIFYYDMESIHKIRQRTKMSVVGSALALHSVTTAGCRQDVLCQNPLGEELEQKKVNLIRAMTTVPNVLNTA